MKKTASRTVKLQFALRTNNFWFYSVFTLIPHVVERFGTTFLVKVIEGKLVQKGNHHIKKLAQLELQYLKLWKIIEK